MTAEPPDAPTLPGLELGPQLTPDESPLAKAVDVTLATLMRGEHLDASRDAARVALARELAAVISLKRTTGRASTVGNDARVLLELLDGMVPAEAATSADAALAEAMRQWSAHLESQGRVDNP